MRMRAVILALAVSGTSSAAHADPKARTAATTRCPDNASTIAPQVSVDDLRLVGIVSKGGKNKALLTDAVNNAHIIKPGDCVGKQRAFVDQINREGVRLTTDGGAMILGLPRKQ